MYIPDVHFQYDAGHSPNTAVVETLFALVAHSSSPDYNLSANLRQRFLILHAEGGAKYDRDWHTERCVCGSSLHSVDSQTGFLHVFYS